MLPTSRSLEWIYCRRMDTSFTSQRIREAIFILHDVPRCPQPLERNPKVHQWMGVSAAGWRVQYNNWIRFSVRAARHFSQFNILHPQLGWHLWRSRLWIPGRPSRAQAVTFTVTLFVHRIGIRAPFYSRFGLLCHLLCPAVIFHHGEWVTFFKVTYIWLVLLCSLTYILILPDISSLLGRVSWCPVSFCWWKCFRLRTSCKRRCFSLHLPLHSKWYFLSLCGLLNRGVMSSWLFLLQELSFWPMSGSLTTLLISPLWTLEWM